VRPGDAPQRRTRRDTRPVAPLPLCRRVARIVRHHRGARPHAGQGTESESLFATRPGSRVAALRRARCLVRLGSSVSASASGPSRCRTERSGDRQQGRGKRAQAAGRARIQAGGHPHIQAPFSSQGLNPYTYAFNSPHNWTDPSGFDDEDPAAEFDEEPSGYDQSYPREDGTLYVWEGQTQAQSGGQTWTGDVGALVDFSTPMPAGAGYSDYAMVSLDWAPSAQNEARGAGTRGFGSQVGDVGIHPKGCWVLGCPTQHLSPEAQARLAPIFDRFGLDLSKFEFVVKPFEGKDEALYEGPYQIAINSAWMNKYQPTNARLLFTIATEITHEVQAQMLGGYDKFLKAEKDENRLWGPKYLNLDRYQPPPALLSTPLSQISPLAGGGPILYNGRQVVQSPWSLEAVAERYGAEVIRLYGLE
jgi:hypothetical protein